MSGDISNIRMEYSKHVLDEHSVAALPVQQFDQWWQEVITAAVPEPNAMTLATSDKEGRVEARTVLLKGYNEQGFVFFTNYESLKGHHLSVNPQCCLLFFWKELERQVRILGHAEKISVEENLQYFNSRPEGSRIGAWASPQSKVVENRAWLENNFESYREAFSKKAPDCPPHWGGYRVVAYQYEFWQGRPSRMHDRILYTKEDDYSWKIRRLAP